MVSLVIGALICTITINATQLSNGSSTALMSSSDDEWEDYSTVTAKGFYVENGESNSGALYGCTVQRRMSCGEREYRIHIPNSGWYPVNKNCPISGYSYCVYYGYNTVYCWNM